MVPPVRMSAFTSFITSKKYFSGFSRMNCIKFSFGFSVSPNQLRWVPTLKRPNLDTEREFFHLDRHSSADAGIAGKRQPMACVSQRKKTTWTMFE